MSAAFDPQYSEVMEGAYILEPVDEREWELWQEAELAGIDPELAAVRVDVDHSLGESPDSGIVWCHGGRPHIHRRDYLSWDCADLVDGVDPSPEIQTFRFAVMTEAEARAHWEWHQTVMAVAV